MTAKEFVQIKIDAFVAKHENLYVRYQFEEMDGTHLIEILPEGIIENDELVAWESEMIEEFGDVYPAEGLFFVTEESLAKIENPTLVFYGDNYCRITSPSYNSSHISLQNIIDKQSVFVSYSCFNAPMPLDQQFELKGASLEGASKGKEYLLAA